MLDVHFKRIDEFIKRRGQGDASAMADQMIAGGALNIIKAFCTWTRSVPSLPGMYLYRDDREWLHVLVTIKPGSWQLSQNPLCLYGNGRPLQKIDSGWWFGPIPESPKSMFSDGE